MSNDSVITEKAKLRKIKHNKHLRQLTQRQLQLQLYAIIIKRINTFKRFLLVIHLVMAATYMYDRLWYI
jgi:hypothetical protein